MFVSILYYKFNATPNSISNEAQCFSYSIKVLVALREIISREKLFDQRNPTIIICSAELEEALDMKALHLTEIK